MGDDLVDRHDQDDAVLGVCGDHPVAPVAFVEVVVERTGRVGDDAGQTPSDFAMTAVATRLEVTTQAIWSCVAERAPWICGSDTLAAVTLMA